MDSLLDIVARVKRACLPPRAEIGRVPRRDRFISAPRSVRFHWRHTRAGRPSSGRCTRQARELDGAALIHRAAPRGHGIRPDAASRSYLRHLGRTLKVRHRRPRYDRTSRRTETSTGLGLPERRGPRAGTASGRSSGTRNVNVPFSHPSGDRGQKDGRKARSRDELPLTSGRAARLTPPAPSDPSGPGTWRRGRFATVGS